MKIYKTRFFDRWSRKLGLSAADLIVAVEELNRGLIDAHLGGGLIKKRIAISGKGKRSGARAIIATKFEENYFFIFGFEKSAQANISQVELEALKMLADDLLSINSAELITLLAKGKILEVEHES